MRIRKLFTLTSLLISFTLLTANLQAANPREKKLIGSWQPVKVNPYVSKTPVTASAKTKITDTTAAGKIKKGTSAITTGEAFRKSEQLKKFMDTQMRTTMKINADGSCLVENPGKKFEARWKLKKKGTNLVIKVPGSGQKVTLELVKITDSTATTIQRMKIGDVVVNYRKQK